MSSRTTVPGSNIGRMPLPSTMSSRRIPGIGAEEGLRLPRDEVGLAERVLILELGRAPNADLAVVLDVPPVGGVRVEELREHRREDDEGDGRRDKQGAAPPAKIAAAAVGGECRDREKGGDSDDGDGIEVVGVCAEPEEEASGDEPSSIFHVHAAKNADEDGERDRAVRNRPVGDAAVEQMPIREGEQRRGEKGLGTAVAWRTKT